MTPQERLALALQYQKQRDLGSALPSTPAENAARPVQEPEQSWLDKLSEAASGFGYRKAQDLEGLAQAAMHPVDTLHSFAVGVGKAMDNPSAAAQAAWQGIKQSAGEAVSSPYNLGSAVAGMTSFNPRKLAAMLESPAVRELTVYHGTPHRFPATEANPLGEFDASKIGTGEGAQAYGHGVYLAESPDVAINYQPRDPKAEAKLFQLYKQAEQRQNYDAMEVLEAAMLHKTTDELREQYPKQKGLVTRIGKINEKAAGGLYAADLPDEMIDRMLDWDASIKSQPENVRQAVEPFMNKYGVARTADIGTLISAMEREMPSSMVSGKLRDAGIPGIKYLDAGSRGATGTGTRNFVVFPGEEKKVKILERK